jgi:hypothetical protein
MKPVRALMTTAAAFMLVGVSQAAEAPEGNVDGQKIVRVCTLSSVDANREFQRNVQIMQAQRQAVIQLKAKLDEAKKDKEKEDLQKQLDEAIAKLNADNKKMFETYGFSLTRNYILVPEKAHVYMIVSDEEAKKIADAAKKKEGDN